MKKFIIIFFLSTVSILCFDGLAFAKLINRNIEGNRIVFDDVNNTWWYPQITDFVSLTQSESQRKIDELNALVYGGFNNWQLASHAQVDSMALSFNKGNDILKGFELPWEPFFDYFTPVFTSTECFWGGGPRDCETDDYNSVSDYIGWVDMANSVHGYCQVLYNTAGYSELVRIDIGGAHGAYVVATVPIPAAIILLGSGLVALAVCGRKKFKK